MKIFSFLQRWKNPQRPVDETLLQRQFDAKVYHYLNTKNIKLDESQKQAIVSLKHLYAYIHRLDDAPKDNFGVYLWGGVGTGKTLLMDMLYRITDVPKIRLHHHHLFKNLMNDLHKYKKSTHPLEASIKAFVKKYQLACFDDLHLNDIADAKLWQGVFEQSQKQGLTMLITSNTHPKNLLDTPGYREKIQPLLNQMQSHLTVVQVEGGVDYRTMPRYHHITQHSACLPTNQLEALYEQLTERKYAPHSKQQLNLQNRSLICHSYHDKSIFFTLAQLCSTIRSYADYIELCERFNCIILLDFDDNILTNPLSLKRFIWLIDIIYDRNCRCFIISDNNPINILRKQEHSDLNRTISRLKQML